MSFLKLTKSISALNPLDCLGSALYSLFHSNSIVRMIQRGDINLLSIAIWCLYFSRLIFVSNFSGDPLESFIPDDGYYYLDLARNRQQLGFWTMDGVNPASGFHLLWGYFILFIYSILGSDTQLSTIFYITSTLNVTFLSVAFYCTAKVSKKYWGSWAILLVFSFFLSPMIFRISTNLLESSLYVMSASLLFYYLWGRVSVSQFGTALVILVGIATRIDFLLLPAVALVTCILSRRISLSLFLKLSSWATLFSLVYFLHNLILFGHPIQRSAQIKLFVSGIEGPNLLRVFYLNVNLFISYIWNGVARNTLTLLFLIVLSLIFFSLRKKSGWPIVSREGLILSGSSLLMFTGYAIVYRLNSAGLQPWYSANFLIVGSIFLVGVLALLPKYIYSLVAISSLALTLTFSLTISFAPIWTSQPLLKLAAQSMNQEFPNQNFSAWNSGILTYYSKSKVTNLDGLVNDSIYEYVTNYRTFDYLIENDTKFVVDFQDTLDAIYFEKKGLRDPRWGKCIVKFQRLAKNTLGEEVNLYRVIIPCN